MTDTTMNTGAAIEPCPFCGSTNIETTVDEMQGTKWGFAECGCSACGPEVRTAYNTRADAPWRQDAIAAWNDRATTPQADADFKNFHRLLCERFDYVHDEGDWKRDQLSLIEHIASRAAIAAGGAQEARDAFDAWNDSQTALEFEDSEAENHARFIFTAGYNAAALPREAPNGWQPIETAPKDGRMFLGWVDAVRYGESDEGVQFEVNVSEQDFCRWVEHHGYFENMMGQIGDAYHVTHWMPLPAAPAESTGAPK